MLYDNICREASRVALCSSCLVPLRHGSGDKLMSHNHDHVRFLLQSTYHLPIFPPYYELTYETKPWLLNQYRQRQIDNPSALPFQQKSGSPFSATTLICSICGQHVVSSPALCAHAPNEHFLYMRWKFIFNSRNIILVGSRRGLRFLSHLIGSAVVAAAAEREARRVGTAMKKRRQATTHTTFKSPGSATNAPAQTS